MEAQKLAICLAILTSAGMQCLMASGTIIHIPSSVFSWYLALRTPVGIFARWHGCCSHTSSCSCLDIQYYIQEECYSLLTCRYVQAPLAYPRERKRRMNGGEDWLPFCIYYDGHLGERLSPCYWSDYYSFNERQPENTKLAPWVARFYSR